MTGRKGWCPGLFDPMPSGDGLLVRVKPPRGIVPAAAALALAGAASRHGNGTIELTRRGNLQIRGLAPASVAPFAEAVIGCGLANADPDSERRRAVMVSPLVGDDPSLAPGIGAIAEQIERGLIEDARLAALPAKFAIVVDGGGVLPLVGVRGDITVRSAGDGFVLSFDGVAAAAHCTPEETASRVLHLVQAFTDPSPSHLPQGEGDSGARLPVPKPIGFHGYEGTGFGAFGLGVPFGHMTSAMLSGLADLAIRFGDGMLRPTPWRAVLIGHVAKADAARLRASAGGAGLIADADDPRCGVVACPGRPSCSSASVATRADAALLIASGALLPGIVHISGCGKGCAHSGSADVTLIGDNGRYGLVRNGSARMLPEITGLTMAEAIDVMKREVAA